MLFPHREKTINNLKSDPKYYEKAYYYKNSKKVYWLKNKVKEKGWTGTDNEISQKLIELYKSWTEYSALRYLELKLGKKTRVQQALVFGQRKCSFRSAEHWLFAITTQGPGRADVARGNL